ncbi:MAG: 1,4-dihydroxy-2-naphthoate octaprenyltransferase [Prevotellaceae bacterium]|nr:1,4-dihydroxy-2-naphthoate octaprenyltransferase [Prevotellaceae bacterium]
MRSIRNTRRVNFDKMPDTNTFKAWLLAARPKTLTAAAVPVMVGAAYAWRMAHGKDVEYSAMLLCFLFAFVMQIDANFVNDYFDCVKGADNENRLGPQRACQQGWVTLSAMRWAMFITTVLAALIGLPLIFYGGLPLIVIGMMCLLFCFLYTTLLAGKGMGDLLVIIFFGLIPCGFTCYVMSTGTLQQIQYMPWTIAVACGIAVDTLLIVNNYRDIDNDRAVGKRTMVVLMGKRMTEFIFLLTMPVAVAIVIMSLGLTSLCAIMVIPVLLHIHAWHRMLAIGEGRELNKVLGVVARNIFVFGILTTLLIIFS